MKLISDKVTMAIAAPLHSFDLPPTVAFEDMREKLSDAAVISRYRNDPVFHAKVCSLTASVLRSVGDDITALTRQFAGEWQPIETAPKDEAWIVVTSTHNEYYRACVQFRYGHWYDTQEVVHDDLMEYAATHWMPLPEAPANGANS